MDTIQKHINASINSLITDLLNDNIHIIMIPDGKEFYSLTHDNNKILVYKGSTFGTEEEFQEKMVIMYKQEVIDKWKKTKNIDSITASNSNIFSFLMKEYEKKIR